jgi:hypothetical protein
MVAAQLTAHTRTQLEVEELKRFEHSTLTRLELFHE